MDMIFILIFVLLVVIALFFTILFSIKNGVEDKKGYIKRDISLELDFDEVSEKNKNQ